MVLGANGYLGWPTCMHLSKKGHEVMAVDNYSKKVLEEKVGVKPLSSITTLGTKIFEFKRITNLSVKIGIFDVVHNKDLVAAVEFFKPQAIVHYAEQPSAPYSMLGYKEASYTVSNNTNSTLSILDAIKDTNIHLVKLGTMGEYGTPNIDIPEGYLTVQTKGRSDTLLFPKQPGSFYHCSKVADSTLIDFACRTWGTLATDLNQGVVYGTDTEETLLDPSLGTSFHYDSIFGTVLNRFVTQAACGVPLTVYGSGTQTRGYINIQDTLRCVELACMNPPKDNKLRVFNQFTEQFSVLELAEMVLKVDKTACIEMIKNPRVEKENHYYNAEHTKLKELGLTPSLLSLDKLEQMFRAVKTKVASIDFSTVYPEVRW